MLEWKTSVSWMVLRGNKLYLNIVAFQCVKKTYISTTSESLRYSQRVPIANCFIYEIKNMVLINR